MEKSIQINFFVPKEFVNKIDVAAKKSGSTRSDFIRRSLEYYLKEFGV